MINRTLYFGEGLFETFRLYYFNGKLYFPENIDFHYKRLLKGLKFFNMPSISFFNFKKIIKNLFFEKLYSLNDKSSLDSKKIKVFRAKLIVISLGDKAFFGKARKLDFILELDFFKPLNKEIILGISKYKKYSKNPLNFFKTTCYSFNILVKKEALKKGYYDNIILNEKGEITETSSSNIYLKIDGKLYTPPIASGILPGSIRDIFIKRGIAKVKKLYLKDLLKAQDIYISNAILGFKKAKVNNLKIEAQN